MADANLRRLVDECQQDADCGWSMGTIGAIAEFVRDRDEPVTRIGTTMVTGRGGIRLTLPDAVRAVAYETPAGPHDHWNHAVAFCLPAIEARCATRTVVTELGADSASLRPEDRDGILFDLGLGTPTVDACVRTSDPMLIRRLRAAAGGALFGPGSAIVAVLVAAQPHRVFGTACGRIEVYTAIPPPDGRSPDGPHTHLLPHRIRGDRTHAATAPIPDGLLPCAYLYPPHPSTDQAGRLISFDIARHRAFQDLLARYGDLDQRRIKAATLHAVRTGSPVPVVVRPELRAAVAVALRQMTHTDATGRRTRRPHHPVPDDLLDPDGDRNAC